MFPNMDEEVIEAVLRANNGAVDETIDQLLTMNTDGGGVNSPSPTGLPAEATPSQRVDSASSFVNQRDNPLQVLWDARGRGGGIAPWQRARLIN